MDETNNFESDIRYLIKKESTGSIIFDISLRGGSIETDIVRFAEQYGYDARWTDEEKAILAREYASSWPCPDHYIEGIYDESVDVEEWLNFKLEDIGILEYAFVRLSDNEVWGLFPLTAIDEYYGSD